MRRRDHDWEGKGKVDGGRAPAGLVESSQSWTLLRYQRVSQMAMVADISQRRETEHRASGKAPPSNKEKGSARGKDCAGAAEPMAAPIKCAAKSGAVGTRVESESLQFALLPLCDMLG